MDEEEWMQSAETTIVDKGSLGEGAVIDLILQAGSAGIIDM